MPKNNHPKNNATPPTESREDGQTSDFIRNAINDSRYVVKELNRNKHNLRSSQQAQRARLAEY